MSAVDDQLTLIDAYWRAANYLSVGQIYLLDNPLLREPLPPEHIKPRLLGHWGTTPGLNFIYAHLNRVISERDLDVIYVDGPGARRSRAGGQRLPRGHLHRGLSAHRPRRGRACAGCFGSSRSPAGSPATSRPRRPARSTRAGSWATASLHAYGAAFDNPDLIVACVVGDGEAETGPLAASWHSNKFLEPRPRRRGAADPASQRLQDRQPDGAGADPRGGAARAAARGTAMTPIFVDGRRPGGDARADGRARSTGASDRIAEIQRARADRRGGGATAAPGR